MTPAERFEWLRDLVNERNLPPRFFLWFGKTRVVVVGSLRCQCEKCTPSPRGSARP